VDPRTDLDMVSKKKKQYYYRDLAPAVQPVANHLLMKYKKF
jgi:hypothetical protein